MNATDTKSYQEGKRQSLSWKLKAIHRLHRRCDGLTRTNTYMPIHSYSRVPPIHMLHQCYVERLSCIYIQRFGRMCGVCCLCALQLNERNSTTTSAYVHRNPSQLHGIHALKSTFQRKIELNTVAVCGYIDTHSHTHTRNMFYGCIVGRVHTIEDARKISDQERETNERERIEKAKYTMMTVNSLCYVCWRHEHNNNTSTSTIESSIELKPANKNEHKCYIQSLDMMAIRI